MVGLGVWFLAAWFLDCHIKRRERENAEEEETEPIENPVVSEKERSKSLNMDKTADVELMSSVEPKESGSKLL